MNLLSIVEQKSLLKHPFYKLWLEGKLPKEALQKYAVQYYQLVANLPRFISRMHANCGDSEIRHQLLKNINEEERGEGNGDISHAELWLDFAEELGVDRNTAKNANHELLPETIRAVKTIQFECNHSLIEGAAALYAYESQVPQISVEKIRGLKENYNITSPKALRFFRVHAVVDKKHGKVWDTMIKTHAATNELQHKADTSAHRTAQALWTMFDAMYEKFVPQEIKIPVAPKGRGID